MEEITQKILTWQEVLHTHKQQTAVRMIDEKLLSIICSPKQNKILNRTEIIYSIPNRKHYEKISEKMKQSVKKELVQIFIKLNKNAWINSGFYHLVSYEVNQVTTDFLFKK
jgi:hypothetical protein